MRLLLIILLLTLSAALAKSTPSTDPPGIALVLAGGGAKGLAHIGFLRALEENDVRISAIAGTSMGALMAGLYACGYSADQLDSLTSHMNWDHLFSSSPDPALTLLPDRIRGRQDLVNLSLRGLTPSLPQSAVSNMRVGFLLSAMTGPIQVQKGFMFDSLRIPLRVVASDLISRDRIVFSKGPLYRYLLASMAIPGIFPPVREDSLLLVDGGVFDNMPVDAAVKAWPGLPVLAVSVSSANPEEYPDELSMLTVTGMTYSALSARANEHYYVEPKWLFTPDLHDAELWSFHLTDSLVQWGYQQGMEWIADHPELPRGGTPRIGLPVTDFILRNTLFSGNESVSVMAIDRWLPLAAGDTLNTATAMDAAENLYASGLFSMVRFTMRPTGESNTADLAFTLTERDPGSVGLGLSYNNDFGLDARVTIEHKNTFNRGIRSIINTGGGNGYAFLELSAFTNTQQREGYINSSASIYQIKGWETDHAGENSLRIWTDHDLSLNFGTSFSWFGVSELSAGYKGRTYPGEASESFPYIALSSLADTRENPTSVSPGTRVYLRGTWSPGDRAHYSMNWDIGRIRQIAAGTQAGIYTWGSFLWGDNYTWQESRLSASRGIPGYRWNSLPTRERAAGGISIAKSVTGPVFLKLDGAATYDFSSFADYDIGDLHWGVGISASVNIPGGTASLGPGWTENGDIRWSFSYGSDYSFGPGR